MFLSDLEIFLLLAGAVFFTGFYVWLVIHSKKNVGTENKFPEKEKTQARVEPAKDAPKISIFESYDYLGTKIYHHDGKYTVVEDKVSRKFNTLNDLPSKYRKMILEMETQKSSPGRKNNYYMENINGQYLVVFPDGKRKTYKSYKDIPENLKKILSS